MAASLLARLVALERTVERLIAVVATLRARVRKLEQELRQLRGTDR